MAAVFEVLAEENRRRILDLLVDEERPVGDLVQRLSLSQPAVSKHLKVLRDAGLVEARTEAQRRVYRLRPEPLMELDAWLAPFRRFWTTHVDALERHLDRMAQVPPSKTNQGKPPQGQDRDRDKDRDKKGKSR